MAERQNKRTKKTDKCRILITYCSDNCHALRVQMDPFEDNPGTYCDRNGQYVKIDEKDCAKCKHPVLYGISREEYIKKMAKAIENAHEYENGYSKACTWEELAEAALDALSEAK